MTTTHYNLHFKKPISMVWLLFWGLIGTMYMVSCGEQPAQEKRLIVATTAMVGDMARAFFPDDSIVVLMGAGVDPHTYKATQGDLRKIGDATLILYNGHKLEGKLNDVLFNLRSRKPTIAISELLPQDSLLRLSDQGDIFDPHIWFDLVLWKDAAQRLADTLAVFYPAQRSDLREHSLAYTRHIDSTHTDVEAVLAAVPAGSRILITSHDAFSYFGRRYNLDVRGLQGISTAAEFGINDIARMVDYITENNIAAVFVESSVSSRPLEAVVRACQAKGHNVTIGGMLYSDSGGSEGTLEATLAGMIRHNADIIARALQATK